MSHYPKTKAYFDGSHYIGIAPTAQSWKKRNEIERRKRLYRKVYLQEWRYFVIFTYDDKKLTETEFREKLTNCLRHLASRNKWKYIGV